MWKKETSTRALLRKGVCETLCAAAAAKPAECAPTMPAGGSTPLQMQKLARLSAIIKANQTSGSLENNTSQASGLRVDVGVSSQLEICR
mgnify:CR=1 FL=1